jgi:hypothetical protein
MSWLVAVCFPGLLMLSTHGLQRLESVLHGECVAAGEVVARLEQAARAARAAREKAAALAVPGLSELTTRIEPGIRLLADEPGLPTRPNRQFQPTGYANPV